MRPYTDLASALFLEVTDDGRVVFANEHTLRLLRWTSEELVGKVWLHTCVSPPDQAATQLWLEEQSLADEPGQRTPIETSLVTHTGDTRLIKWTQVVLKHQDPTQSRLLMCGHDITALRKAESSLNLTLRELHTYKFALDASSILAITDKKGHIVFANDKFCAVSQYSRQELLGNDHRMLNSGYHPKTFFKKMWQTIGSGNVWREDIRNRAKDWSYYWVDTTIVPVLDPTTKKPIEYIAIRNEVTARKEAEAALENSVEQLAEANCKIKDDHKKLLQAEKMASVGLLAAGVAHEINNPLSGVMACLKALEEGTVRPERRTQYFATARDGLERIQQTVRGLLDFSRQRPPSLSTVNICEVIEASTRLIAPHIRKHQVEVILPDPPHPLEVYADRSQLMQAVVNLLLNATYASPIGGSIECSLLTRPNQLGLCFADQGPGMTDQVIERACEPFFSTKPEGEGTGLGLAVTRSIAEAHGGELRFERQPHPATGTRATLWLPNMENANV